MRCIPVSHALKLMLTRSGKGTHQALSHNERTRYKGLANNSEIRFLQAIECQIILQPFYSGHKQLCNL